MNSIKLEDDSIDIEASILDFITKDLEFVQKYICSDERATLESDLHFIGRAVAKVKSIWDMPDEHWIPLLRGLTQIEKCIYGTYVPVETRDKKTCITSKDFVTRLRIIGVDTVMITCHPGLASAYALVESIEKSFYQGCECEIAKVMIAVFDYLEKVREVSGLIGRDKIINDYSKTLMDILSIINSDVAIATKFDKKTKDEKGKQIILI